MPSVLISLGSFYASYFSLYMPNQDLADYHPYSVHLSIHHAVQTIERKRRRNRDYRFNPAACRRHRSGFLISIRLYSASVLHYGQRLKIGELIKLRKKSKGKQPLPYFFVPTADILIRINRLYIFVYGYYTSPVYHKLIA